MKEHKSTKPGVEEMYFHIREGHVDKKAKAYQAATVFARQEAGRSGWHLSVARCSVGDQFSRSVGRNVSRKRYFRTRDTTKVYDAVLTQKPTYEDAVAVYKNI